MEERSFGLADVGRWSTTVYLDTENLFHWAASDRAADNIRRQRTALLVHRGAFDEERLDRDHMALGDHVFLRLVVWLDQWAHGHGAAEQRCYDLRSYGSVGDAGVESVRALASANHWVHVGVGPGENAADLAIANDLADRSRRPGKQVFLIGSSDHDEVLAWSQRVAEEDLDPDHEYYVMLGPNILDPVKFEQGGELDRLRYVGAISEMYRDVVRRQRDDQSWSPRLTHENLFRRTEPSARLARPALLDDLGGVAHPDQFLAIVIRRCTLARLVRGAKNQVLLASVPAAVYDAWCAGHPQHQPAEAPLYATAERITRALARVRDHGALALTHAVLEYAVRRDPDDRGGLVAHLAAQTDQAQTRLGPRRTRGPV